MCFDTCEEAEKCFAITKPDGKVIVISGIPSAHDIAHLKTSWFVPLLLNAMTWKTRKHAQKKNIDYCYLLMRSNGEQLANISTWVEEQKIVPLIDKVFKGIGLIPEAMDYLEMGHCTGKVVVHIGLIPEEERKK